MLISLDDAYRQCRDLRGTQHANTVLESLPPAPAISARPPTRRWPALTATSVLPLTPRLAVNLGNTHWPARRFSLTTPDESASYRQPAQKALGVLSGEWVIPVLYSLATRPRRSMELLDEINQNEERLGWTSHDRPLTRKVFSNTMKAMQRDGLVIRTRRETTFGAVWYQLTPMGRDFLRTTVHLAKLGLHYGSAIDEARVRYDHETERPPR